MLFVTNKHNFVGVAGALAVVVLVLYRKRGLVFLVTLAAIVGLNDIITHHVLKAIVQRPRPCVSLPDVILHAGCSTSFSFPSNHASNMFTAATFSSLCFKNSVLFAFLIAFLVAYSRVYLGVHYPADVLAGAVWGLFMGGLGYLLYLKARRNLSC